MCTRLWAGFFLVVLYSCDNRVSPPIQPVAVPNHNPLITHLPDTAVIRSATSTLPGNLYPVMGYRFQIRGDFDGDGRPEILTEHYYSRETNGETNKFYEGLEYEQLVDIINQKQPYGFVSSSNPHIGPLKIPATAPLLGLSFLKNEGDLNGDGTDEISYVVDWADWSSLNSCHVMTYRHGQWQQLVTFDIWDWQLPDLPQALNTYGLFGLEEKEAVPPDEKLNRQLQANLEAFPGFIRKMDEQKVQVICRNENSDEDTIVVDLRKPR